MFWVTLTSGGSNLDFLFERAPGKLGIAFKTNVLLSSADEQTRLSRLFRPLISPKIMKRSLTGLFAIVSWPMWLAMLLAIISPNAMPNDFLRSYRSELFPEAAVVSVLDSHERPVANSTGVIVPLDLKGTLELALKLQPDTERVYLISGTSEFDKIYETAARQQVQAFSTRAELIWLSGLQMTDMLSRVAGLPPHSVIYYLAVTEDAAGNRFLPLDVLRRVSAVANAPIYSWHEVAMDHGIVGGSLQSGEVVSGETAKVALRVLRGKKPESVPIETINANVIQVDWRQLRRWGINENNLPAGTNVRFKELTFWEQYKWRIIAVISLCILQSLLIVYLLVNWLQRKRAEKERERFALLAEAGHRRLDEVVSNVPGIVWESRLAPDGTRVERFVSQHVEKMLGYTVEEWMSEPRFWLSIIPEDERQDVLNQNDAIFQSGKDGVIQFRWRAKDGRLLWVEAHASVIRDEHQQPVGLRGVTLDITDRKLAESSLLESEERNRAILSAIPDLMFLQTVDGLYLDFHAKDHSRLLVAPRAFLGRNVRDVLPPSLAEDFLKCFRRAEETREPQTFEYALPIRNEELWFEASIVATNGDRILSVVRDVTKRKRAEATVRESEARFRGMANTAPVMMWMSGVDKLCTFFNRSWLEFTGRTLDEECGNGWAEGVHHDDYAQCLKTYTTTFDERKSFRMEYRLRRFDGEYRWLLDEGVPRYTPDGDFVGYIGSCVDFTERRTAEEGLRNALAEVGRLKDQLEQENIYLQDEIRLEYDFQEIVGQSNEIKYVLFKIEQVAPTDATVLILGETGTGKELVARAIHSASKRRDRPMVKINCATLPASLIESELFGHEKGAFTGAQARKIGRFEIADGATLFLDEIGELPLELQAKLLRVLQEGEFERLGSSLTRKVDVRIIAATNRNLKVEVQNGLFREDLWYRLNVFPITVPPLRQRRHDIPALVSLFVNRVNRKLGRIVRTISPQTLQAFQNYAWPGNVRELANVVERAVINSEGAVLRLADKLEVETQPSTDGQKQVRPPSTLEEVEREHIIGMLNLCDWRIEGTGGAAELLGINSSTLRSRMSKLGIRRPGKPSSPIALSAAKN